MSKRVKISKLEGECFEVRKEVTNEEILSAVTELITSQTNLEHKFTELATSQTNLEHKFTELATNQTNLEQKIDETRVELKEDIAKLDHKMDLIDQKFMLTNYDLRTAQAEIKVLQRGVN